MKNKANQNLKQPIKNKNTNTSDIDKTKRTNNDEKKKNDKKPIMVDAWTQTEKSDYAMIKYKMQKRAQKQQLKMLGHDHQYAANHSGILSDSGYRKNYERQISNSFKAVSTPHNNRSPSYVNSSYKHSVNLNNRTMRDQKSYNKTRDGAASLKSHSNARGYKNAFYDSINSGQVYKESNIRGGSISMGHRRKSKRGAEITK